MSRLLETIDRTLAELAREGRLSEEQRSTTSARLHGVLARQRPDLTAIVASLGALLMAAGILYLIGYNWEHLGKPVKLALIFGLWFLLHLAGWRLAERPGRNPRTGRAFTLLGVLAFGGAIGLVAQIYHLSSRYPNAILLWWALSIPVVLVTRSRAVLVAVMNIAFLWSLWHLGVWIGDLPSASNQEWMANYTLFGGGIAAALLALAALSERSSLEPLAGVLRQPVVSLAAAAPFVLAFHEPWTSVELWGPGSERWSEAAFPWILARMLPVWVGLGIAGALLALATARRGARATGPGWLIATGTLGLAGITALAPRLVPWAANLLLFGGALALCAYALRRGRVRLANAGVFLFVAGVVARYFEYLWDKLEGAYAFLATGALLMAAAWFLESRRRAFRARAEGGSR